MTPRQLLPLAGLTLALTSCRGDVRDWMGRDTRPKSDHAARPAPLEPTPVSRNGKSRVADPVPLDDTPAADEGPNLRPRN